LAASDGTHALMVKVLASYEKLVQGLFLVNDEEHFYDGELVEMMEKGALEEKEQWMVLVNAETGAA
jgi:hypothetical protein